MAMYSPSAYAIGGAGGVGAAKSEGGGVFGMLMSARAEVEEEKDAQLAAAFEKKLRMEEEKYESKRLEEEKASEALANRMDREEKDEMMAYRMEMEERKEVEREVRARREREMADAEAARKFAEEEKAALEEIEDQAGKDQEMARALQSEEVAVVKEAIDELTACWKQPKVSVVNVENGIDISVHLPMLKSMKVCVDPETKVIVVKANPDFSELVERLQSKTLPSDMQMPPVRITLDLKIVGKEEVTDDEIVTKYDKRTSQCYVHVKNAFIRKEEKQSFLGRFKTGMKRMLSRGSMSEE